MLDYKKLKPNEIINLRETIKEYQEYDRLDLMMLITFGKEKLGSINNRKINVKTRVKKPVIMNNAPEAIKYCDGDKCSVLL